MKIYRNFSKYFNTNPRLWIIIAGVVAEIFVLLIISLFVDITINDFLHPDDEFVKNVIKDIILIVAMIVLGIGVVYSCWEECINQMTLVYAHIGTSLKERGYDVKKSLDEIESELENPIFAQIYRGINKSMDFIITRNWIVGTDDLLLMSANAVRISEIVSVDLNEMDLYSFSQATPGIHARKKHYNRIRITDKEKRIFSFCVMNERCQKEAYDFISEYILDYGNKQLGYKPIEYQRGKVINGEYRSECLEYCLTIPEGCTLKTQEELERESTSEEVIDFECRMPSGANVAVKLLPMDGSVKDIDIDYIGNGMVESIARKFKDRQATYYGIVEIGDKKFAHSCIELDRNGVHFFNEFYTYFAPYCQIMFAFGHTYETKSDVDVLKRAFRGVGNNSR